jgi:hypothetical protein
VANGPGELRRDIPPDFLHRGRNCRRTPPPSSSAAAVPYAASVLRSAAHVAPPSATGRARGKSPGSHSLRACRYRIVVHASMPSNLLVVAVNARHRGSTCQGALVSVQAENDYFQTKATCRVFAGDAGRCGCQYGCVALPARARARSGFGRLRAHRVRIAPRPICVARGDWRREWSAIMDNPGTAWAVILNNPELRQGMIREAAGSGRSDAPGSTRPMLRHWLGVVVQRLTSRPKQTTHLDPTPVSVAGLE